MTSAATVVTKAANGEAPRRRRVTSYDVAKLAGVSQSAVSRVFQEGASASKNMRDRVLRAANELGYSPNAIARGLITQRSNMVAVIISKLTNQHYPEALVELTQSFSRRGIRVLLFVLESERERDIEPIIDHVLQYQLDGIVATALMTPKQLHTLDGFGVPVVFYNRTLHHQFENSVRCDLEEGERWLVGRLVAAGHKSFGLVEGPSDSAVSSARSAGALQQLRESGITDLTRTGAGYGYDTGRRGLIEIVTRRGAPPDAVICANDVVAIGCIDEARQSFGLRVPHDMSIVGFDGVGPASYAAYNLTTVRQPIGRMAEAATSMLIERIKDRDLPPEKRTFSGLRVRGGSARFSDEE